MENIIVTNCHRSYALSEACVRKLAQAVVVLIKKEKRADLEIVFLGDRSIRRLNRRYKGEDAPTDVLSFRIDRKEFGEKRFLGEIFISIDTACRNSKVFGTDIGGEVVLYIIHGIGEISWDG